MIGINQQQDNEESEKTLVDSEAEDLHESFSNKLTAKRASLTPGEFAFLRALLIDPPPSEDEANPEKLSERRQGILNASQKLDDEILFSVPEGLAEKDRENKRRDAKKKRQPSKKKKPRDARFLVALWQAHEDGVSPKKLNMVHAKSKRNLLEDEDEEENRSQNGEEAHEKEDSSDGESVHSDVEVRGESPHGDESSGTWDEDAGGYDHFDSWLVLKDEYASDFGFDFSVDGRPPSLEIDELENVGFKILGTSADDTSAWPHVLSPPLMDSIFTFIPDHLQGTNVWLKYSLVRDGASLDTLKQYARASKETIIAIETTKGDVFGCFTSSAWRTNPSFYGNGPSFIWKMRYNRRSPCHSLFEQAEMESNIDIFLTLENGQNQQCCTSDQLAVGEGALQDYDLDGNKIERQDSSTEDGFDENYGFAIALSDDLMSGTTSKCQSYKNPCLVNGLANSEAFEVLNLELWTFTPCFTVESAEKLEMTQFFISESIRSTRTNSSSGSNAFSSQDLDQKQFYRHVGHDDANEEVRERWQLRSMMDGDFDINRGVGGSPHFNNAGFR